ncbi:hypothetical protein OH786_19145 [Streptomyces atratus]|uniref:hypothetical protein n=1 Tax=Streptomyces atratus TaxID=1893 RepID=UPI0032460DAA
MNEDRNPNRLAAEWAVLGKHPGRSMGYEVLDGSLPGTRAQRYLWSATTGTPDAREPAGGLPWRVFLSGADGEPGSVCAVVDTSWDGSKDGTGRPSYTWRLLLLEWRAASRAGVTWTALDRAVAQAGSEPDRPDASPAAVRTSAAELADTVDRLGFEWAAGMAALLLEGEQLVITAPPGRALPGLDERVRMLDAVCSLLPYGCRAWLSGATWTGRTEHDLRLVFAASARSGQQEVPLGTGRPPAPRSGTAGRYLTELLRLRAKRGSTADVVAHLLAATTALPLRDAAEAVRLLQELDLLDSVLNDIRHGHGQVGDVQRLLELHSVESLDEGQLETVVVFLADRARRPGAEAAQALLTRHWTPRAPDLLAAHVVARTPSKQNLTLAKEYLTLLLGLEGAHPGSFDRLFTALATAPGYDPAWAGCLVCMVEKEFGYDCEAADRVLLDSREAGLAWLDVLFGARPRDLRPLSRLVALAAGTPVDRRPGWLRFAGLLTGEFSAAEVVATDAAEFASGHGDAWRIALETARDNNRPAVIGPMWTVLRQLVRSGTHAQVSAVLDSVAPPGAAEVSPQTAADADLLRMSAPFGGAGGRLAPTMRRLRLLGADDPGLDAYTATVVRRTEAEPELKEQVVEALLGDEPDPDGASWTVLSLWMRQRPSIEPAVRAGLARRLTSAAPARWIGLDLPEDLVDGLVYRDGLAWLRPVRRLRAADTDRVPLEELGRIVAEACPHRTFSPQLLDEVALLVRRRGSRFAFGLTTELDVRAHGLGLALYQALGSSREYQDVRDGLVRHSREQENRHRMLLAALGAAGTVASTRPGAVPTTPRAVPYTTPRAVPPAGPAVPPPEPPDRTGAGRPAPLPAAADYPPDDRDRRRGFLPWSRKRRNS